MTRYVCGFAFTPDGTVALIRKKRPDWLAGYLNGIGGHIEPGEVPHVAMAREFLEETGISIIPEAWDLFAECKTIEDDSLCYMFRTTSPLVLNVRTTTDEEVGLYEQNVITFGSSIYKSVPWQLAMALNEPPGSFAKFMRTCR